MILTRSSGFSFPYSVKNGINSFCVIKGPSILTHWSSFFWLLGACLVLAGSGVVTVDSVWFSGSLLLEFSLSSQLVKIRIDALNKIWRYRFMEYGKFKDKVSNLKNLPLPGVEAQLKLAPILRIQE